jgi:hypothetical protein
MPSSITTLLDLFTRTEFLVGFGLGVVALLLLVAAMRFAEVHVGWGLSVVAAVVIAEQVLFGHGIDVAPGLIVLGIGGWLFRQSNNWALPAAWTVLGIGALALTWLAIPSDPAWLRMATPFVALAIGRSLVEWRDQWSPGLLGPLLLITAFGIWATVPDTELARILIGVLIPLGLATAGFIGAKASSAGAFALGGLLAWVPAVSGLGRPGAIIGGWACIGILALVPAASRLRKTSIPYRRAVVVLGHLGLVFVASRVVGLWDSAAVAALAVGATAWVALFVILRIPAGPTTELEADPDVDRQGPS